MNLKEQIYKCVKYILNRDYRFLVNSGRGVYDNMPDKEYLERKFRSMVGYALNLEEPRTFNEKLQWLKLHNRKPEYTVMVDKYLVRDYIREKLGEKYLIPLIGVWDTPDEIDFSALPDQFVLKCNHNSGLGMYICTDKKNMNADSVKANLRKGLKENYYLTCREWPYKDVPRKIVCEKYMVDESGTELKDYKILCFNGEPRIVEIHRGRFGTHTQNFYDVETWKEISLEQPEMAKAPIPFEKPPFMDEMVRLSRILCRDLIHVRIDWYYAENRIYFGEITFFDGAGFEPFSRYEDDLWLGSLIQLPDSKGCEL